MDTQELYEQNQVLEDAGRVLDEEIKKFNWGAFGFSWIWGAFNGAFKATFLPWLIMVVGCFISLWMPPILAAIIVFVLSLAYPIYVGLHGNQWAWEGKTWKDIDTFTHVQKSWAVATLVIYIIHFICVAFYIIVFAGAFLFVQSDIVQAPTLNTAKMFSIVINSNSEISKAENGREIASGLVESLNTESSTSSVEGYSSMKPGYKLYNNNSILVSRYDYAEDKLKPKELYTFYKKGTCSLQKKNCYIIAYEIQDKKPVLVSKLYYDSTGKTRGVNLNKKKSRF